MPHIRPDCAKQSAKNSPLEQPRKLNSIAVRLTRDVLLLRSAGSSRRAIAAALNLSQRRVQTILDGAAPSFQATQPFVTRERDADYASVEAALRAGSTMRAEHLKYATRCPAPYAYSYFWRRFEDWLDAQPDPRSASRGAPGVGATSAAALESRTGDRGSLGFLGLREGGGRVDRRRSSGSRGKVAAKLRLKSEIRVSPANTSDARLADTGDTAFCVTASEWSEVPDRSSSSEPRTTPAVKLADEVGAGSPLEGGLLFISEPDTALQIRKGALCIRYREGKERTFPRGRHRLRSIMLTSPGANVTIEAMRFAIDEGITIFVMHRAGEALAVLTDAPTVDASAYALELRRAQFAATSDRRLEVARAILAMKIQACELAETETRDALRSIAEARDHEDLLIAEAQTAKVYWKRYVGFRPRLTERCPAVWSVFRGRLEKRGSQLVPRWARTPCNAALNYGYAVTLGNCTRSLVGLGLDPAFGFLPMATRPAD